MELILFTHKVGVGVRTNCICPRHFCPCESLIPRQWQGCFHQGTSKVDCQLQRLLCFEIPMVKEQLYGCVQLLDCTNMASG